MLNGTGLVKSSWSQYYGLYFEWSATQSVTNNDSEITFTVYADFVSYGTIQVGARNDGKMSISGQEQTVYMPAVTKLNNGDARIKLATIKKIVKHRDDGTLPNVVLKAVWPIRATIAGVYRSTIEGTFSTGEIKRIPRASEIKSSVDFTLENNLKVNLKRYSDDFKHDVLLKINGSNFKTITNVNITTTITFTETEINNLYNQSVNVSELSTELVVTTKQNTTTIGTTSKKGKVFIDPIKNAPTFEEFEFKPDSKTTSATGWNDYITEDNNLSILEHTIYTIKPGIATGKNGATITGFEISLNNRVYRATGAEFTLPNAITYNDNLIVSAVDSRGFKTKVIKNIRGQQYTKIKFDKLDIKRRVYPYQEQVNFEVEGTIFKNDVVNNQLTFRVRSREVGMNYGSWINLTSLFTIQSNGKFTANFNCKVFYSSKAYDVEIEISDIFYTEPFKIPINMEKAVVTITKNKFKFFDYDILIHD